MIVSPLDEIEPIAGSVIDPYFADAAEIFHVAHQAGLNPHQPYGDTRLRLPIPQLAEPEGKIGMLADLDHA